MGNEYNNGGWGCGCGWGAEMLILLIFFALFANGNNGWGNNNGNAATAAETAALVQQDNLRANVANIGAQTNWTQQLTGGLVQAAERIGDKVDRNEATMQQLAGQQQLNLCQLGNNLTQQLNGINTNINEKSCATNAHIDGAKDQIIGYLVQQQLAQLQQQNADLKVALATKTAEYSREADKNEILNAIRCGTNNGCCGNNAFPFSGWGNTGCCGNGINFYQQAAIGQLAAIAGGVAGIQQSQTAQTAQLTALQAAVAKIPTAAA